MLGLELLELIKGEVESIRFAENELIGSEYNAMIASSVAIIESSLEDTSPYKKSDEYELIRKIEDDVDENGAEFVDWETYFKED